MENIVKTRFATYVIQVREYGFQRGDPCRFVGWDGKPTPCTFIAGTGASALVQFAGFWTGVPAARLAGAEPGDPVIPIDKPFPAAREGKQFATVKHTEAKPLPTGQLSLF